MEGETEQPDARETRSDTGRRLRIGVVGLSDIAEKAYLPVLAARADVAPVLITRNAGALHRLGARYRIGEQYQDLRVALAAGLDAAFVHAATDAHTEIVERLLTAGVPVFVDKPLAYRYDEAARVAERSISTGVPLMVGFNRRFAPAYREVGEWPQRDIVVMHKHRTAEPEDVRRMVFDDFIHVVDTLRFLVPSAGFSHVSGDVSDGRLRPSRCT